MIYKIKHKQIKKSFSAKEVRFIDDFYLVSYIDSFSVIARRDGGNRLIHGDNFFEFIDVIDRTQLKTYVYSDNEQPLVLRTDLGTAIINKYFVPSTLLYSVFFLRDEEDGHLADILLRSKPDFVCFPEHYAPNDDGVKISKDLIAKARSVLDNYKTLIKDTFVPMDSAPRITVEKLYDVIEGISRFSGCAVDVSVDAEIICTETFDLVSFKSFLLAMLMLARRESISRSATVKVESFGCDVSVRVSFDSVGSAINYPEVEHFLDFADRNNMFFEPYGGYGGFSVRFAPARKDWSLLELKAYVDFDWDS